MLLSKRAVAGKVTRQAGFPSEGYVFEHGGQTREAVPVCLYKEIWAGFWFLFDYFFMKIKKTITSLTALSLAVLGILIFSGVALASIPDCQPDVSVKAAIPFWESYSNFLERKLTVDETIENKSNCLSCQMEVVQINANQGVALETPMPLHLDSLPQIGGIPIRIHYRIPVGISHFSSRLQVICERQAPQAGTQPLTGDQLTIDPPIALANEGCPVDPPPELVGKTLPNDQTFGAKLYTATLKDEAGNPLVGKMMKWQLSDSDTVGFRILNSTDVTNTAGQVTAEVTPPPYFVCISPYYNRGMTWVTAVRTKDGLQASGSFDFERCAPLGSRPPWLDLSLTD